MPWTRSETIIFRKKAFWMLITLLCPEYVTWIALGQWQKARRYKEIFDMGDKSWTMQHAFYVDMGGLQLMLPNSARFQVSPSGTIIEPEKGIRYDIRHDDLILSVQNRLLKSPDVSASELKERSKNDRFAQVITVLQIVYFTSVTFGRVASRLPISPLEVSTLAFVCCAAFVEYFWWHKPLDMRSATVVELDRDKIDEFIAIFPRLAFKMPEQDLAEKIDLKLFFDRILGEDDMKENAKHAVWIGCIFNGIHISAWFFIFPSLVEQRLWQVTSVTACASVGLMWVATFIRWRTLGLVLSSLCAIAYCICRIYLVVEVFAGLRLAPAALYESPGWQNALPGA